MTADLILFKSSLRDLTGIKKLIAGGLLAVAPALVAVAIRSLSHGSISTADTYSVICGELVFGFALVILAVVFGTATISQEIEQKTIVYLLTHALPRWRILVVKLAAATLATIVTAWLSCALLALATYGVSWSGTPVGRDLVVLPLGALAYNALFVLLASVINRPLIVGLVFAFGWESWVPNMPGDFQRLSLMAYLRALAPHNLPQSDMVDISQMFMALSPATIDSKLAWEAIVIATVFCLAAAILVFSTKQYAPKDETG